MSNVETGHSTSGERTFSISFPHDQLTFALHQVDTSEKLLRVSLLLHRNPAIPRETIAEFLHFVGKEALGVDLEDHTHRRPPQ